MGTNESKFPVFPWFVWEVLFLPAACSVKSILKLFQKTEPSVCLKYNTINILLAYTYMVMRYNGEHHDMCVQCAEDFVSLSQVLLTNENCKSTSEAIRCFCASLKKVPIKPSSSAVLSVFCFTNAFTQIFCVWWSILLSTQIVDVFGYSCMFTCIAYIYALFIYPNNKIIL